MLNLEYWNVVSSELTFFFLQLLLNDRNFHLTERKDVSCKIYLKDSHVIVRGKKKDFVECPYCFRISSMVQRKEMIEACVTDLEVRTLTAAIMLRKALSGWLWHRHYWRTWLEFWATLRMQHQCEIYKSNIRPLKVEWWSNTSEKL